MTDDSMDAAGARLRKSGAKRQSWMIRRGHALSFTGLFLFTVVLYFRPYELFSSLSSLTSLAFWIAVATLLCYLPSQLVLEGNLTARPREVNLILLLSLAGLLSIPLAISPAEAWGTFVDFSKFVLMFIVLVNVTRTERRLRVLIVLGLVVGCVVSAGAIRDFQSGRLIIGGERIRGLIGNLFDNPNDLALYLAMMTPLALGLALGSRGMAGRAFYAACAALMAVANVLTLSRGGFLGLASGMAVLIWRVRRRHRMAMAAMAIGAFALFFALAPDLMMKRFASTFGSGEESMAAGSAVSRRDLLFRSIYVSLRHPLLGVGMGNFHTLSIHEQVSHNAYTQVSSEMGIPALVIYILFLARPLRRLRLIEHESVEGRRYRSFYYTAVGLQACLWAYLVSSFFGSVAYNPYVYYPIGYVICLHRLFEAEKQRVALRDDPLKEGPVPAIPELTRGSALTAAWTTGESCVE